MYIFKAYYNADVYVNDKHINAVECFDITICGYDKMDAITQFIKFIKDDLDSVKTNFSLLYKVDKRNVKNVEFDFLLDIIKK